LEAMRDEFHFYIHLKIDRKREMVARLDRNFNTIKFAESANRVLFCKLCILSMFIVVKRIH
jgi:hypothetical protein